MESTDARLVQQQPHIRFILLIRELAAEIAGEEQDPLEKARRTYDYITAHVIYSFMCSYFILTNIPQYAAPFVKGDCGVQVLLSITLCRGASTPVRWQVGFYTLSFETSCYDWAQFYTNAHGRRCADYSSGGAAYREGDTQRWDFYFGSSDPFRLPTARRLGYESEPSMTHLRDDPYDSQIGEVEYEDRGLLEKEYSTGYEVISLEDIIY